MFGPHFGPPFGFHFIEDLMHAMRSDSDHVPEMLAQFGITEDMVLKIFQQYFNNAVKKLEHYDEMKIEMEEFQRYKTKDVTLGGSLDGIDPDDFQCYRNRTSSGPNHYFIFDKNDNLILNDVINHIENREDNDSEYGVNLRVPLNINGLDYILTRQPNEFDTLHLHQVAYSEQNSEMYPINGKTLELTVEPGYTHDEIHQYKLNDYDVIIETYLIPKLVNRLFDIFSIHHDTIEGIIEEFELLDVNLEHYEIDQDEESGPIVLIGRGNRKNMPTF